ncbi:hypothetical protein Vi05172_g6297 [Venturia inaequalis]|nr:hypothetical protein Vi05172_g6297 [Venturia inaequalis]
MPECNFQCGSTLTPEERSTRISTSCQHEGKTCRVCLERYILVAAGAPYSLIGCPSCMFVLQPEEVYAFLQPGTEIYDSYARALFIRFLQNSPGYSECLHCGQGHLYDHPCSDAKRRCLNDQCQKYTCGVHNIPWHEGQSCQEYDADTSREKDKHTIDNKLSMQRIQGESKACPGCHKMIFRQGDDGYDGCEHMTCTQCYYEFCYGCLLEWEHVLDYGHDAGCSFNSS